ncbi:DUF4403 family protein [Emticicia sp. BO119]|uniref:DUF4403 family protein n=1 Tax=Emticicia sp. BO119 TaxID=2757768 RepID=UPI0015F02523|nr:DUF4403 family protein [Emticicia sp. BO119]MBA4853350.1 DUF4403 family protein [Emticicia sp. BO119]
MKKLPISVCLIIISVLCPLLKTNAQKANPEAPEERYLQDTVKVQKVFSNISIPFDISMNDIERQINASITGLIYEDNSYTDGNNDNFKCKVWKKSNIIITAATNDVFDFTVPLKVWAEQGFGAFGIMKYVPVEFEMNLKFSTRFTIRQDWAVQTFTTPNGYEWITKPKLNIGFNVPLDFIVGKIIDNNHTRFAKSIDDAVAKNLTIKPYVVQAWNAALQPYLVSDEYRTWVRITPLEIFMTPLVTTGRNVKSVLGLRAYTETITGDKPVLPLSVTTVPNLKLVSAIPNEFQVGLMSEVPYAEAAVVAKKMFIGKTYDFKDGKYKIEITGLDIYGSNEFLVIKADVKGNLKGTIYIKGIPVYNASKKSIVLSNTQFDIKTKNILAKAAAWVLEGRMVKMIEDEYGLPVDELLNYAKQNVEMAMNTEYRKGVKLSGKIESVSPDKVYLTPSSMVAIVLAKGKVELKVDGL